MGGGGAGELNPGLLAAVAGVLLGTALTVSAFVGSTAVASDAQVVQRAAPPVDEALESSLPAKPSTPPSVIEPASISRAIPCAAAACEEGARESCASAG